MDFSLSLPTIYKQLNDMLDDSVVEHVSAHAMPDGIIITTQARSVTHTMICTPRADLGRGGGVARGHMPSSQQLIIFTTDSIVRAAPYHCQLFIQG